MSHTHSLILLTILPIFSCQKNIMFNWSENEVLLLEKAKLCERFLTFSNKTIQNFPLLSNRWIELFRSIIRLFSLIASTRKRLFPIDNNAVISGQKNLFNQVDFFISRFSEGNTFHQTAARCVIVVVCDYCSEKTFYWAIAIGDIVAGYNNRISRMKPVFRLFTVLL